MIFMRFWSHLESYDKKFASWTRKSMDLPLGDLMVFHEDVLMVEKWTETVKRALEKQEDSSKGNTEGRLVKDHPLAVFKQMAKVGSRRPS
jgi:hypothetical protein